MAQVTQVTHLHLIDSYARRQKFPFLDSIGVDRGRMSHLSHPFDSLSMGDDRAERISAEGPPLGRATAGSPDRIKSVWSKIFNHVRR